MIPDDATIFVGREANGVEIENEEIDVEMQRRVLDLLHYHDVRHDCSKHSVIVMEADGGGREGLISRVFSSFKNAKIVRHRVQELRFAVPLVKLEFYILYRFLSLY